VCGSAVYLGEVMTILAAAIVNSNNDMRGYITIYNIAVQVLIGVDYKAVILSPLLRDTE